MPEQGTLAITARGDGTRWYGRVSISEATAQQAGLKEGTRVTAKCLDGMIIIQADENGRIKFPGSKGKVEPRHAFEAATTTLGLREIRLSQALAITEVIDGQVRIRVPDECLASELNNKKKPRKEPVRTSATPPSVPINHSQRVYGTAAAIITEANRSGKKVRPMTPRQIVDLLKELGQQVDILGPRLFRLNNRSVTISDLLDAVGKLGASSETDKIVLIMDN